MADHLERIGQIIGDYRLTQWLGGGGFGNVYLAEQVRNGQQVAIKTLQARLSRQDDLHAFINEARTIRLRHPHIIPLLDFGLSGDESPFLVMEYAPQGTLRDRHPRGTRVPLLTIVEYATQMASALQYAHEYNLIHRDVKPENMLIRSDGVILLSDFGIATTAHSTHSLNAHHAIGGTLPYISPEQLAGQPRPASDQYALAVVVYEWISGRTPFRGTAIEMAMQHTTQPPPSLVEQVPELPREVETVLFTALAKDHKERFASMQAFITALQHASFSPTFRQFAAPGATRSLRSISLLSPLPPTLSPPAEDAASLVLSSRSQLSAQSVSETPLPREIAPPVSGSSSQKLISTAPAPEYVLPPGRTRRFSKGWGALLVVLVVLLIAGGSYAAWAQNTLHRTTASLAHRTPTATVRATATVAPPVDEHSYNGNVTRHGIMFGFDAERTHNNPYEHILNSANVSQLHQVWTAATGQLIYSSPAVADGVVYVGSNDHQFYAFDAATGKQKWVTITGDQIDSAPAVANGVVYIGSNDGNLYAFNAASGQLKWTAPASGGVSSPVVVNGMVYSGAEGHHYFNALDAATGQQKWTAPTGDSVASSPAVANGLVYVGCNDHNLYAFDAATGQLKWTAPTGAIIFSSPAVANGLVYVGSEDHQLYAFDAVTGQQKWVAPTGGIIFSSPAVANGLVYIGSYDYKLHAFDAATGQPKWTAATGGGVGSSPTVANGLVYVGSEDHQLYAFDAASGQPKWTTSTGDFIFSSPLVANGMVYVGSKDHQLYAFSLPQNGA